MLTYSEIRVCGCVANAGSPRLKARRLASRQRNDRLLVELSKTAAGARGSRLEGLQVASRLLSWRMHSLTAARALSAESAACMAAATDS